MHKTVIDRDQLLSVLTRTLDALEQPLPATEAMAVLSQPIEATNGTAADAMAGVLEDAREFMLRDVHVGSDAAPGGEATRIPSSQNLPYIPSHRALSLFQSALDEFLEQRAAEGGAEADFDPTDPGWLGVAWEKLKALFRGKHRFTKHVATTDFVESLPDDARIALVSDWGTGTEHAIRVMQQVAAVNPTHVIHLGDVYYSGTRKEIETRFLAPIRAVGPAMQSCVYRALNSNHEMYSGGDAYFELTLPTFGQRASYFNLRSTHWQFVALDSGHEDHGLRDPQDDWLDAQLDGPRRSILLTHHQMFSAFEDRPEGKKLAIKIRPFLPRVFAWFWGHEHKCIIYQQHEGIHARCIGHGAIPYKVPFGTPAVPLIAADERSAPDGGGHHGFALLALDGARIDVTYIDELGATFHTETLG